VSRVALAGFLHETNTFSPYAADLAAFRRPSTLPGLTVGEEMIARFPGLNVPVAGAMQALRERGHELLPIAWASAVPSGAVTSDAFETIAGMIVDGIRRAEPDGVYLDLHGAMVTEELEDPEGELIRRVRDAIGPDRPLTASFDLHANLTRDSVMALDGIAVFETYPHLDMAATGARAAAILHRRLSSRGPIHRAFRKLPYLVPLHAQCTDLPAGRTLYEATRRARKNPALTAAEFAFGFPPADIRECGPAIVVLGDDPVAVEAAAEELERIALGLEGEFALPVLDADEAVLRALRQQGRGPVIIADTQDNPGCGGAGDTVGLLRALMHRRAPDALVAILHDPAAAALAHRLGVGVQAPFSLGAHSGTVGEAPVEDVFRVEALTDGKVVAQGPMYRGNRWELGRTALLSHGGVRVIVSERRLQAADTALVRHVGLEPRRLGIIVLKSTVHFRADFGPIAGDILIAKSPGLHLADNRDYAYRRLRPDVRRMPSAR
jgi:microcystin degradation protein MlrC